jgi:hypothetical protein
MNDSAWAGVLMTTLAVIIAIGFITVWVRDRGRAKEQATDTERTDKEPDLGPQSREGAAEEPHDTSRERRH